MSKRILIVEDEADNLTLLIHILRFMLMQENLLTAADGHEAMRVAYDANPDLILMDLSLPKLSGWEATRSLRGSQQFKETTILALTAHAMVGDKERALEAGCNDYFPKPIDIDAFIRFIQPYLAERKLAEASLVNSAKPAASTNEAVSKPAPQPEMPATSKETVESKPEPPRAEAVSAEGEAKQADTDKGTSQTEDKKESLSGTLATSSDTPKPKQESSTIDSVHDEAGGNTPRIDKTDA